MFLKCTHLCRKKIFFKMTWTKHDYEPPLKLSGKSAQDLSCSCNIVMWTFVFTFWKSQPDDNKKSPYKSYFAHISNPPKSKNHSYLVIESESECFLFIGSRNRRRVTWTMLVLSSRALVFRQMRGSNIWQILTNIHWENIFKYQQ